MIPEDNERPYPTWFPWVLLVVGLLLLAASFSV